MKTYYYWMKWSLIFGLLKLICALFPLFFRLPFRSTQMLLFSVCPRWWVWVLLSPGWLTLVVGGPSSSTRRLHGPPPTCPQQPGAHGSRLWILREHQISVHWPDRVLQGLKTWIIKDSVMLLKLLRQIKFSVTYLSPKSSNLETTFWAASVWCGWRETLAGAHLTPSWSHLGEFMACSLPVDCPSGFALRPFRGQVIGG